MQNDPPSEAQPGPDLVPTIVGGRCDVCALGPVATLAKVEADEVPIYLCFIHDLEFRFYIESRKS